ncbi:hypothetical protein [Longimicrobium sp.]|uniref:hypothetical protein n=1 Tax=Longimicrobium sp. TaxID=2029185 RepID=UPI002E31FEBC|nr:hypothetical protein [Longimicrobium sp.]HEX6042458.1 hypothetical protein [Longimicrobium sp.]
MDDEKTPDEQYADDDPGGGPSGGRIPPPPVPRDEWVARVVDDPASGLQPVLLQGYVGDAADKENTRVYLDASLSRYVDVRNEDVLHHQPLEGNHTPTGGSMVWVRGDAFVSQGTGGGSAAGGFFTGPVLEQNRQPGVVGAARPGGQVHITLLTVGGCHTRGIWCPPGGTAATLCTHNIICSRVCQDPLGGIGPVVGTVAGFTGEPPLATDRCPPSVGCFAHPTIRQPQDFQPFAAAAPMAGGAFTRFPCSAVDACPSALGCTVQGCGPIGVTGWRGCGQPHISLPGCVHTGTCSAVDACPTRLCPAGGDTVQAGFVGAGPQAAIGTYRVGCPTLGFTCTYVNCPQAPVGAQAAAPQQAAVGTFYPGCHTLGFTCTYINCPPQGTVAGTFASIPGCVQPTRLIGCTGYPGCAPHISMPGCMPSAVDACPSRLCPPNGGGVETVQARFAAAAPQAEAHAPGTYGPGCTLGFTCTYVGCPQQPMGAEQAAPQAAAGTYGPACTLGFTCTYVGCPPSPQGPEAAAPQAAAGIPTGQYSPACPSFGFTCTYVDCPPQTGGITVIPGCPPPTGPMGTVATVCTQLGCPRTSTCPPTYTPGCGGAGAEVAAAGPYTHYQGCYTFGFTCTQFC